MLVNRTGIAVFSVLTGDGRPPLVQHARQDDVATQAHPGAARWPLCQIRRHQFLRPPSVGSRPFLSALLLKCVWNYKRGCRRRFQALKAICQETRISANSRQNVLFLSPSSRGVPMCDESGSDSSRRVGLARNQQLLEGGQRVRSRLIPLQMHRFAFEQEAADIIPSGAFDGEVTGFHHQIERVGAGL